MASSLPALKNDVSSRLNALFDRLPLLQLLFVRHAHAAGLRVPTSDDADVKRDLDETGTRQCEDAGSKFFGKLDNVSFIVHTPALRTRKTAQLVFQEQCRSRLGNAPIVPSQLMYPGTQGGPTKARLLKPDYLQAVAKTEAAFAQKGNASLQVFYASSEEDVKAAFETYALHVLLEMLSITEARLLADQDERFACQVAIFGHAVYLQAIALVVAEIQLHAQADKDVILNTVVGEVDVLQVEKRKTKYVKTL